MKKQYDNQYFNLRIKVSVKKHRKSLIVNQAFYSRGWQYSGVHKAPDGEIDLLNAEGVLITLSVDSILNASNSLLGFLKDSHLVNYHGHMRIPKLEGKNFDAIVINDLTGYTNAVNEFEVNNEKRLKQ